MTREFVVWTIILALGLLAGGNSARADLSPYATYTVPGLSGAIQQFDLADVDGDGSAEILASDGTDFVLYSPAAESTYAAYNLDSVVASLPFDYCWPFPVSIRVLLADVNRDSLVDASVLMEIPCEPDDVFTSPYTSRYLVVFIDDALSGGAPTIALNVKYESRRGIGMFDAMDFDGDGYDNLILSVDSAVFSQFTNTTFADTSHGKTFIYHSLPDSVLHRDTCLLRGITPVKETGPRVFAAVDVDAYWHNWPGSAVYDTEDDRLGLIDSTGSLITPGIEMPGGNLCPSAYDCIGRKHLTVSWAGDLDGDPNSVEILGNYYWAFARSTYLMSQKAQDSGQQMLMFRYVAPDSLALVWSTDVGETAYDAFLVRPDFPNRFLAIHDDTLMQFDAADGSVLRCFAPLPAGQKSWVYPYGDGVPYLMIVSGQSIAYYTLDDVTDVSNHPSTVLPTTFTLGRPYPNPFNPTVTIPLTVDQKGLLRVEVFNPLGQKVAVLHDAVASPGETTLNWNASAFGSGVYLIKATLGENTRTVKAVLVK